jgi:D-alanyl-D-alanine carboxypeptidase
LNFVNIRMPVARVWMVLLATLALTAPALAAAQRATFYGPSLVFDAGNDEILLAEEADTPWYPASLTKLMTAYVVFDAIKAGRLTLATEIVISPRANAQPKTRVGLGAGKRTTVDHALQGLIIRSANDFAVALAEKLAGSEDAFVVEMNQAALRLGMVHTQFVNSNGLPLDGQATTARDMALLARALIRDFPEHSYRFAEQSAQIGRVNITSHNDLLKNFDGADGMKTGFTCGAGYNIVASATRNGRKIVAVVLGERNNRDRASRAGQLLEAAFATPPALPADLLPGEKLAPEAVNAEALLDAPPAFAPARHATLLMTLRKCFAPAGPAKLETAKAATGQPAGDAAAAAATATPPGDSSPAGKPAQGDGAPAPPAKTPLGAKPTATKPAAAKPAAQVTR